MKEPATIIANAVREAPGFGRAGIRCADHDRLTALRDRLDKSEGRS